MSNVRRCKAGSATGMLEKQRVDRKLSRGQPPDESSGLRSLFLAGRKPLDVVKTGQTDGAVARHLYSKFSDVVFSTMCDLVGLHWVAGFRSRACYLV